MKPLIAFASAAALGLVAVLALHAMSSDPVPLPRPKPVDRLVVASAVPDRWPRAVETVRVTLPKPAALPTLAPASVAAFPVAVVEPEIKKPPEEAAVEKHKRKHWSWRTAERDICRGKGKRYTNSGRSWRCRR
jgi:hypothetical protein